MKRMNRVSYQQSLTVALLAACGPALAHGSDSGASHAMASWANAGAAGGTQSFSRPETFAPTAATVPLSNAMTNATPQAHVYTPLPTNNLPQDFARPTLFQLPTAQPVSGHYQNVNLDLTSASASVLLQPGVIQHASAVTISMNGVDTTFQTGDRVTPAQLVAIYQSQVYGGQKIVLDSQGRAEGGSFSLNSVTSPTHPLQITGVVVPQNVTAVDYVSTRSEVNVRGDLLNYGSIVDVSRGNAAANISAFNIVNAVTGSISTGGSTLFPAPVSLNLNAVNDFTNLGSITSSGALNITAGGTIYNGTAGSTARPNITAAGDVHLVAPGIVNSGTIASNTGNVTLGAPTGFDLNVNNIGGTISALNGAINVREADYAGLNNTAVVGGDLLSKQLNLHSGGGMLDVTVNDLTGNVVSDGLGVHVFANTETLSIGSQCLTGDPTYYNTGNIALNGNITAAEAISIIAGGNITADFNFQKIEARDGAGQGYNITMIAGANNVSSTGINDKTTGVPTPGTTATGTVTFTQPTSTSLGNGKIDLSAASNLLQINSYSTKSSANGGNVYLAAFGNGSGDSGSIILPDTSNINASGGTGGSAGSVGIYAGSRTKGGQLAIQIGSISNGALSGANAVSVITTYAAQVGGASTWSFATNGQGPAIEAQSGSSGYGKVIVNGNILADGAVRVISGGDNSDSLTIKGAITSTGGSATLGAYGTILVNQSITAPKGINAISNGDVLFVNSSLSTASTKADAGDIVLLAGQQFTFNGISINTNTLTSTTGGRVGFTNGGDLITTSTALNGSGGNIIVGAKSGSASFSGNAELPAIAVTTSGSGSGANGSVTIYGNAQSTGTNPNPVSAGSNTIWNLSGGSQISGNIDIRSSSFVSSFNINTTTGKATGSVTPTSLSAGTVSLPFKIIGGGGNLTTMTDSTYVDIIQLQGNFNNIYMQGNKVSTPDSMTNSAIVANFTALASSITGSGITVLNPLATTNNITLMSLNSSVSIGNTTLQAGAGGITIVAQGTVTTSAAGGKIITDSASGNAGNINILAGALFSYDAPSQTITLTGGTGAGNINFASNAIGQISASSGGSGSGGAITIAAFGGGTLPGQIITPAALTISANSVTGTAGSVLVQGTSSIGTPTNPLSASATGTSGGSITLSTGQPLYGGLTVDGNGKLSSSILTLNDFASDIYTGTLKTTDRVTLLGYSLHMNGNVSAQQIVGAARTTITVDGNLTANQITPGVGGGIVLVSGGSISATNNKSMTTDATVSGVNSGSISLVAGASFNNDIGGIAIDGPSSFGSSNINISANTISTKNTMGGKGGNFTAVAFADETNPVADGKITILASGAIDTSGNGPTRANGNVEVVAGNATTTSILLANGINIAGGQQGTGNVLIAPLTGCLK